MLSKNELKYYSLLLLKKYRKKEKKFLVEGVKLIREALDYNYNCEIVFYTNEFLSKYESTEIFDRIKLIRKVIVKNVELKKVTDTQNPSGIVAVFNFKNNTKSKSHSSNLIVGLENISDPGNLGTIIRNCDWFGIKEILLNSNCAEIYNPKVIRASAGSIFHLKILEAENFYDELNELKSAGYKIYCSDLKGCNVFNLIIDNKSVILFSNEASGPSQKLLKIADEKITIPRLGKAESLNVANASAVILAFLTKKIV
ncbi:TrmH family RNA methyltransferase [Melioribacteraceae bacterium 4301-Me]|uniref:TrmH family RNA methyltransferase n=1 Tax=Pyranulibacter aquaticus TaxID=3163344 RepID=UPI0035989771